MLTIIHGEDTTTSRKKLSEEKSKFENDEMIFFDGKRLTINDLVLATEASSMLFTKRVIIIENLLLGTMSNQKKSLVNYLAEYKYSHPIILWENKEIGKAILNKYFSKAKQILCKYPSLLFRFLESIGKVSSSATILSFHNLLKQMEAEFVFAMLFRQWRNLILIKSINKPQELGMPSWQMAKYREQTRCFSLNELVNSYRQLLNIDYKIKSGQAPYNLIQLLDIFFLSL